MDRETIERLYSERTRRINEASEKLLEKDDQEGAEKDLAWADMASQVLASAHRSARLLWYVIITCACLLIVGLVWTMHISSTLISLEIASENVTMTLKGKWLSNYDFVSDKFFINNIRKIRAPGLDIPKNPGQESVAIDLQGKEITLNNLSLTENAEIEMTVKGNDLKFFVKGASLKGEFLVQNADLTLEMGMEMEQEKIEKEIPEPISFETFRTAAEPVRFELASKEKWHLRGLQVSQIGFMEENPPGSGKFESAVRSGRFRLPETGFKDELREADRLILKKIKQSRRLEISKTEKGVKIFFEGSVAEILAGPKGFEKDLTPTWLEYLYHQKLVTIFWSAIVFLFGMLWRIRNIIFIR